MKRFELKDIKALTNRNDNKITVIKCSQAFAYVDGKRTNTNDGYNLECVLKDNGYEKINIKIRNATAPPIAETAFVAKGEVDAEIAGFSGFAYVRNNEIAISATAEGVKLGVLA